MNIIKNVFKLYSYAVGGIVLVSVISNVLDKYYFVEDISDVQDMEDKANEEID